MLKNIKLATNWRDETHKLLLNRPISITLEKIERDTGLRKAWLSLFSRGKISSPSVNAIETLRSYLLSIKH